MWAYRMSADRASVSAREMMFHGGDRMRYAPEHSDEYKDESIVLIKSDGRIGGGALNAENIFRYW